MKKNIFGLVIFLVCSSSLFAQETTLKEEFGIYIKGSVAHNYNFKLNNSLTDIKCKKIPDIFTYGLLGCYFDINKIAITLDLGVGGMYSKTTRVFNFLTNVSVGYKLALPKKQSLISSGNIAYEGYNVITRINKGDLDLQNAGLSNSTAFFLELSQCMIGPKITWCNNIIPISIGYDFGIVPFRWKSNSVNVFNSPKERIDRIHIDFEIAFSLLK